MPQLNPAPWFMILLFSWLVFLIVLPGKVLKHSEPNQPQVEPTYTAQKSTWTWPWY
uniref:ATP synthase complex subunit 8 n=1 Tax=Crossorhombus azureus TaxID=366907 RepID=T1P5Z2_CROAZ|nr:ATP synthase F0 subunit 8 [Crossorhombus azureus]AFC88436.1 ATP synthase subunit 8 [Crossorhombus azureus]